MRQFTYRETFNYSYLHAFNNPNVGILEHVEHCLELLRIKLICEADTTPHNLIPGAGDRMLITLGGTRTCRDFQKMQDWAHEHITVPFDEKADA